MPIINYELINKNNISSTYANGRAKVVDGLLQNEIKPNLGLKGSGPEISVMRSTLFAFGILKPDSDQLNLLNIKAEKMQNVILIIKDFFVRSGQEGKQSFAELYKKLTSPEHGIGLKRGVIPIYIAVVLHMYKKHAVLHYGAREVEITARGIELMSQKPENYFLILENWSAEKEQYIEKLEKAFSTFTKEDERQFNTFDFVARAMQRWFLSLPKYAKEVEIIYEGNEKFSKISQQIKKLRNQLRQGEINSRELLFDKMLMIFGTKIADEGLSRLVVSTRKEIDGLLPNLYKKLVEDIVFIFKSTKQKTAISAMKEWVEGLGEKTKNHLFNGGLEKIFELVTEAENNEQEFVFQLTKLVVGIRIEDWENRNVEQFFLQLKNFKKTVEELDSDNQSGKQTAGAYKISFVNEKGEEETKILNREEISKRAHLLYNDILTQLEEFGDAVTENEKRQVLLEILKKL
jgi:hypothetical protein